MMRRFGFHWSGIAVCGALLAATLPAAETNLPPSPSAPGVQNIKAGLKLHHLSPVEKFRALLGMSPAERERALAHKTPADKAVILAKLQEYEALPRGVREARLCQTELQWELSGLMRLAPRERSNQIEEVSVLYRPMVESLLQQWDTVPADTQKALLEKQSFIGVYLHMQGSPAAVQQQILNNLPPERRAHWAEEMDRWQALPVAQRAELCAQFQRFCAMSGKEQKETASALPDAQRQEMEKALATFNRLPPAQRAQCINSFGKFATMATGERNQFLKNAARWEKMTLHERQLWRELVRDLPPMPPGLQENMPPMPPRLQESRLEMPPMPPSVTTPVVIIQSANDLR